MILPSIKAYRCSFTNEYTLPFSSMYSFYHVVRFENIFFFLSIGPCWNHNDVITLMVPCLPLPILLFNVPSIHLFFFSAHLALFSDDGFLRWVAEGYFCVGSLLKLKSSEAPTPPCPTIYVNAKQNYVSSLVIMFPIWSTSFKWTINVYVSFRQTFLLRYLKTRWLMIGRWWIENSKSFPLDSVMYSVHARKICYR